MGPVTALNWARTRRQRVLRKISFDSSTFDIYDPKFSSEDNLSEGSKLLELADDVVH